MEGSNELRFMLTSDLACVGAANQSLETFLEGRRLAPDVVFSAVLVLEEVITNIIKYAYDDDLLHEIAVEASVDETEIILRICDDGREFNVLMASPPHVDTPLEERPPGGLGIQIVRSMAQRIEYERAGGRNKLILSIARNP